MMDEPRSDEQSVAHRPEEVKRSLGELWLDAYEELARARLRAQESGDFSAIDDWLRRHVEHMASLYKLRIDPASQLATVLHGPSTESAHQPTGTVAQQTGTMEVPTDAEKIRYEVEQFLQGWHLLSRRYRAGEHSLVYASKAIFGQTPTRASMEGFGPAGLSNGEPRVLREHADGRYMILRTSSSGDLIVLPSPMGTYEPEELPPLETLFEATPISDREQKPWLISEVTKPARIQVEEDGSYRVIERGVVRYRSDDRVLRGRSG